MNNDNLAWEALLLSSSSSSYYQQDALKQEKNIDTCDTLSPSNLAYLAWKGEFEKVLTSKWVKQKQLFTMQKLNPNDGDGNDNNNHNSSMLVPRFVFASTPNGPTVVQKDLHQNLSSASASAWTQKDDLALLALGISLLYAFIQENWTGPNISTNLSQLFDFTDDKANAVSHSINHTALSLLTRNGEPAYHLCKNPVFLYLANSIFGLYNPMSNKDFDDDLHTDVFPSINDNYNPVSSSCSISLLNIWQFRTTLTGLRILEDPVPMPNNILNSFDHIVKLNNSWWNNNNNNNNQNERDTTDINGDLNQLYQIVTSSSITNFFEHSLIESTILPCIQDISAQNSLLLGHYYAHMAHVLPQAHRDASLAFVEAAKRSHLEYELTGRMGKRTKFQQEAKTQLVLLARRSPNTRTLPAPSVKHKEEKEKEYEHEKEHDQEKEKDDKKSNMPQELALNDDTLLEKTEFTAINNDNDGSSLQSLDAANQPALEPLHQAILLSLSLHTSNTQPHHGLTSLQSSAFVERVLSNAQNWSVFSMGLLLRSRIESHKTRTAERGYLQLQSLVDQLDLDFKRTPGQDRLQTEQGAPVSERLAYIYGIAAPTRWQLERELAQTSLSLGLVRSSLEIFQKLEMWEDVVRCLGSLERTNEARTLVRQLLDGSKIESDQVMASTRKQQQSTTTTTTTKTTTISSPSPHLDMNNARQAKLWCLLGELERTAPESSSEPTDVVINVEKVINNKDKVNNDKDEDDEDVDDPTISPNEKTERRARNYYYRAWKVSNQRSAQAIRLLGSSHYRSQNYIKAQEFIRKAVDINPAYFGSWFVLGCCAMLNEDWDTAEEAFSRCVSLDSEDAESWNNLASIHLRIAERESKQGSNTSNNNKLRKEKLDDEESDDDETFEKQKTDSDIFKRKRTAFTCLAQAAKLSFQSWKIWYNLMIVAIDVGQLGDACRAMEHVIQLQYDSDGDKCVDLDILDRLVAAVVKIEMDKQEGNHDEADEQHRKWAKNLEASVQRLFQVILQKISTSPRIFLAHSKLLLAQGYTKQALEAHMKAYRAGISTQDDVEYNEKAFNQASSQVVDIVDALVNLGPKPAKRGGNPDEVCAPDYKFQARSILRTFMGRTREQFEDTTAWKNLKQELDELKSSAL